MHCTGEMSAVYSECLAYDYIKCANNGILTHVQPNDFVCMCTEDYYGDRCENGKLNLYIICSIHVCH